MARIFISYAHEDLELAKRVHRCLKNAGNKVFLAEDLRDGIPAGGDWEQAISDQLYSADVVVCLITPASRKSPQCASEIALARKSPRRCRIIPLQDESKVVHELLKDTQYLPPASDWDATCRSLVDAVRQVPTGWRDDLPSADAAGPAGDASAQAETINDGVELPARFGSCDMPPGRDREVAELDDWLDPKKRDGRTTAAITGRSGMNKTGLAKYVAWKASDRFHGRVAYVNMNGSAEDPQAPTPAEQVYGQLLAALGVPGWCGTSDSHGGDAAAAYRRQLTRWSEIGWPVLLILDDVVDLDQVKGLLLPDCHAYAHRFLVISRDDRILAGRPAAETHAPLTLRLLAPDDAVKVLQQAAPGDQRLSRGSGDAGRLARLCGLLPQALWLVGGLLAKDPDPSWMSHLIDRLERLESGGVEPVERRAFQLAWDYLEERPDPVGRKATDLLLLLSANPGQYISTEAAAALADNADEAVVRERLEMLENIHLIDYCLRTDRWGIPNRICEYVKERAATAGRGRSLDLDAAFVRLFRHYERRATSLAEKAGLFLLRHNRPAPEPGPTPLWVGRTAALRYFKMERMNLLDCLRHAAEVFRRDPGSPLGELLVDLTRALAGYLRNDGPCRTAEQLHSQAADIAYRRRGTARGQAQVIARAQAVALNDLGITRRLQGNLAQANQTLQHAELVFRGLSDPRTRKLGQANTFNEMGVVANDAGCGTGKKYHHKYAVEVLEKAWKLYCDVKDETGMASSAKNRGVALCRLDDFDNGDRWLRRSLEMYAVIDDFLGVVEVHNRHGLLYLESRRPERARRSFGDALNMMQRKNIESFLEEARAYEGIGLCDAGSRCFDEAVKYLETAMSSYSKIGAERDLRRVEGKLKDLTKKLDRLRGQAGV